MAAKVPSEVSRYLAEIGRRGGRSKKISPEERRANARRAAFERWRHAAPDRTGKARISRRSRAGKPIWKVAEDLLTGIPKSELRRLPADGASHLDCYLYGAPKTNP